MRDRFDLGTAFDRRRDHQRAHSGAGRGVVVDVDPADVPRLFQRACDLDEACAVATERGIELNGDDPFTGVQGAREACLALFFAERDDQFRCIEDEGCTRLAVFLHGCTDRGDLSGSGAAAAADHLRAEIASMRGELAEVLRRRMRVDDTPAGKAR